MGSVPHWDICQKAKHKKSRCRTISISVSCGSKPYDNDDLGDVAKILICDFVREYTSKINELNTKFSPFLANLKFKIISIFISHLQNEFTQLHITPFTEIPLPILQHPRFPSSRRFEWRSGRRPSNVGECDEDGVYV